jgi:hypothetical protein
MVLPLYFLVVGYYPTAQDSCPADLWGCRAKVRKQEWRMIGLTPLYALASNLVAYTTILEAVLQIKLNQMFLEIWRRLWVCDLAAGCQSRH